MSKLNAHNVFDTLLEDIGECIQAWDKGDLNKVSEQMTLIQFVLDRAKEIGKQQLWDNMPKGNHID